MPHQIESYIMWITSLAVIFQLILAIEPGEVKDFYPEKQAVKMVKIALKEKDISFQEKLLATETLGKEEPVIIYKLKRNDGTNFYAVFTQASGRYDPFDYLLTVSENFIIEKVRVLKYRSEHGGEIASRKWLRQFENYSSGDLLYKKDISALSGATVSAGSITKDIPLVMKILKRNCK